MEEHSEELETIYFVTDEDLTSEFIIQNGNGEQIIVLNQDCTVVNDEECVNLTESEQDDTFKIKEEIYPDGTEVVGSIVIDSVESLDEPCSQLKRKASELEDDSVFQASKIPCIENQSSSSSSTCSGDERESSSEDSAGNRHQASIAQESDSTNSNHKNEHPESSAANNDESSSSSDDTPKKIATRDSCSSSSDEIVDSNVKNNESSSSDEIVDSNVKNNESSSSDSIFEKELNKRRARRKDNGPLEPIVPYDIELDSTTCRYCLKTFTKIGNKLRHMREIHKINKKAGSINKCVQCNVVFDRLSMLQDHLLNVHQLNMTEEEMRYSNVEDKPVSIETRNDSGIRCIECNCGFSFVHQLRKHLSEAHKLNMNELMFRFSNMNAFRKWKCEVERRDMASFTMQHGARKTTLGQKHFYMCHRSGRYESRVQRPRQRMLKGHGTCKLGIVCTAAMYCEERADEVIVRYCPYHYGHGKETSFVQLSAEEQIAIQENVSNGIPFENLLDDIRDTQSTADHHQLTLLKKRDIRFINNAYNADEYNPGMTDAESVEQWVRECCELEDSPVLFYKQFGLGTPDEDFVLIIMTEFQKQILLSSARQVVCVDSLFRRKGARFYLTVLFIIDEYEIAFPVAYCVSNRIDETVLVQFFTSIRESTGPLSCDCFMSDSERLYYDAWMEVMEDTPRWLWSMWYIENRIRVQLRVYKGNINKREEVYKTMRMLLECQNQNVFHSMLKNYLQSLRSDPGSRTMAKFISTKYGSNYEMWAHCYRKDIKLSTNMHLETMHRTFRYCCREGRKKRLDKFVFVIMKLVRYKMLDRLTNMLDADKIHLAVEAINMCHALGLQIASECISSLSNKIWLVRTEEEEESRVVYVTREFDECPEHCDLKCSECDVCVHMYSCSCLTSLINANMCQHIHAVVWKFLTPHFSPPASPARDDSEEEEVEAHSVRSAPKKFADFRVESILKKAHELFKKVRDNKCGLGAESLDVVLSKLNECLEICAGKKTPQVAVKKEVVQKNTAVLLNQYPNFNSVQRPFILPNNLQPILPNTPTSSQPQSKYLIVVPSNFNNTPSNTIGFTTA